MCLRTWTPSGRISLLSCAGALPSQGSSRSYVDASLWEGGWMPRPGHRTLSIGPCPWGGFWVELRRGLPALRAASYSFSLQCHREGVPQAQLCVVGFAWQGPVAWRRQGSRGVALSWEGTWASMSQALLLSSGQERPDTRAAQVCGGSKCKYGLAAFPGISEELLPGGPWSLCTP